MVWRSCCLGCFCCIAVVSQSFINTNETKKFSSIFNKASRCNYLPRDMEIFEELLDSVDYSLFRNIAKNPSLVLCKKLMGYPLLRENLFGWLKLQDCTWPDSAGLVVVGVWATYVWNTQVCSATNLVKGQRWSYMPIGVVMHTILLGKTT